jgi:hypothetical protein
VAISEDDGKTWIGFRELNLTPKRNDADYAGKGVDRSTHQAQMVEVAPGKILASIGQHATFRTMVMFDVDWLYETERFNDFSDGLSQWTVFNYIKGITGHCCYNRIAGCETLSHSEKEGKQMLHLKYQKDESLVSDTRGAVWNFPVLKKGSKGDSVKALQILLKGYGYSLGIWGVDSSFGSATENAVEAYQEDNNLEANGKVDPLTWAKLLGV